MLFSCSTTKLIKKEKRVEIRRVEVQNDTAGYDVWIDLTQIDTIKNDPWNDMAVDKIEDSTEITIKLPKKVTYKPKKKKIYLDKNTSVEVEIAAKLDSGRIEYILDVPEVAYKESTVVETIETDTSPKYMKWIIIIAILAFISIIIIALRRK